MFEGLKKLSKDDSGNILLTGLAGVALTVGVAFVIMGIIPVVQHQLNSTTLLGNDSAEFTSFGKTITNFSTSIDILLVAVIITLVFGAIIGSMVIH
jgi:hypothetical protein